MKTAALRAGWQTQGKEFSEGWKHKIKKCIPAVARQS